MARKPKITGQIDDPPCPVIAVSDTLRMRCLSFISIMLLFQILYLKMSHSEDHSDNLSHRLQNQRHPEEP